MKIAFLTPEYPHSRTGSSGGIGTSIKNLALGLIQEGHQVRVLVYGQKEETVFKDNGIIIQQIKNVKVKGLSWYFTRKKLEKIVNQLFDTKQVDIVEAPDWTGITSFIQPKHCPVVIRLNGSVFGLNKQFTIIPNSIDVTTFKRNETIQTIGNTILYFGSLIRKKGLLELPFIFNEVIKENPKAKLILIGKDVLDIISGSASTWEIMKDLFTKEALLNVNYLGSVPYSDIQTHINKANVCVFPSFAEALPLSWIEAMAMEKAIVASNIGWATAIVDDGVNGFLVQPKEHTIYADKINTLLKNSQMQKQFGLAAREKVIHKFSKDIVATENLSFYKSIIK